MHPDWARALRDQCIAAGVPFFFKQHGEWQPWSRHPILHDAALTPEGAVTHNWPDGSHSIRVGKKAAGRLLDGRTHDAMPGAAT
jgi:protein gp37